MTPHTPIGRARHAIRQRARTQLPPPAAPPAQPPQDPQSTADPYNYESDPVLQRTRALGQRTIAEAEADALRQRRQLALDYGDAQAARELGLSEADIAAAKANPFSVRAKQAKAAHDQPMALDENLNKGNLYYSSARGTQQTNLATALLEDQSNAARGFQTSAGGISSDLLAARRGVEEGNWTAEQAAAARRQASVGDLNYAQPAAPHGRTAAHAQRSIGHALGRLRPPRRPASPYQPGYQP